MAKHDDWLTSVLTSEEDSLIMAALTINEIRDALIHPYGSMRIVQTFTHGRGVQIYLRTRKVGPILFPPEGQSLSDLLATIGSMVSE